MFKQWCWKERQRRTLSQFLSFVFYFPVLGIHSNLFSPPRWHYGHHAVEPSGLRRCLKNTPPRSTTFPSSRISVHPSVELELFSCCHPTASLSATHHCHAMPPPNPVKWLQNSLFSTLLKQHLKKLTSLSPNLVVSFVQINNNKPCKLHKRQTSVSNLD